MSLDLGHDYQQRLRMAKPTRLGQQTIRPPPGALGAVSVIPPQIIPPINTNIQFDILPTFEVSQHPGLSAIDTAKLPKNFNWRYDGDSSKRSKIAKPGNQMLCGSCWAISTAGIVADNHVVSGTVDWVPNLSTTWSLSCFPQHQCQGGNPAKLFQDISQHGIATNHCIDYSWCATNPECNGKATKHFEEGSGKDKAGPPADLSKTIPGCGCYNADEKHYLYFVDPPKSIAIGRGGVTKEHFLKSIKHHIYNNGPVQGGYLVFKNFRSGTFTKVNGGVYLENCVYDNTQNKEVSIRFDDKQTTAENYIGSHAIAIIGWGVEGGVVVDNEGTKKDVPYWYCRNSWTEKWGEGGYFKMAMHPYNKMSQFDTMVQLNTPKGKVMSGAMVMVKASEPPKEVSLPQIQQKFLELGRLHDDSYYKGGHRNIGSVLKTVNWKRVIFFIVLVLIGVMLVYFIYKLFKSRSAITSRRTTSTSKPAHTSSRKSRKSIPKIKGRSGHYRFPAQ